MALAVSVLRASVLWPPLSQVVHIPLGDIRAPPSQSQAHLKATEQREVEDPRPHEEGDRRTKHTVHAIAYEPK